MKRNPNSIPAFLLALVLAVSLVLPVGAAGSGITLDKTSATLAVGQTLTLTATLPESSQDAAITWSSANEAIAALVPPAQGQPANTAVFRGMTAGTVTVTATAGGRTALCTITVAQDTPASVTITPAGPEFLPVGKTRQLTAQVNYTLGSAGNQNVVWSSSDPQVATVDRNGKVTAVAEGTNVEEELGDLLFSAVNVSRFVKVDTEEALNGATDKFIGRFRKVEEEAARQGRALEGMSLAELDKLWEHAKET